MYRRYQGRRYRRRRPKRSFFGTASKAIGIAGSALATAKMVKDLINVEWKSFERQEASGISITDSGTIHGLSLIGEGDDRSNRNGRSLKAKSFHIRGELAGNSSGNTIQRVRLILFQDMHQDGTIPTVSELINPADVISMRNLDHTDRFKILKDRTWKIVNGTQFAGFEFKINKKLNSKIEYIGTSTNQTSQGGGNLYLMFISDQNASNYPTIRYTCRLKYIDN